MANTATKSARLYVRLPEQLKRRIERVARARGMTASTFVRTTMKGNVK